MKSQLTKCAVLAVATVPLMAPSCNPDDSPFGSFNEACKDVPALEWMEVDSTYDKDIVIKLAGEFKAGAELDAAKVDALKQADASVNLDPEFSRIVKANFKKGTKVSQDFYQRSFAYGTQVCNAERWLANERIDDRHKAEITSLLIDLTRSFAGIEEAEKKSR